MIILPAPTPDTISWIQTVLSGGAVLVAAGALVLNKKNTEKQVTKDAMLLASTKAVEDATTAAALAEISTRLNASINEINKEAERFRTHDRDCIHDKTLLASQMQSNTKNIEALTRTVGNLERRVGFAARDEATRDTHHKLTGGA